MSNLSAKKMPKSLLTTVHIVPGAGPTIQFGSSLDVTRSGDGKQIGRTHRLNNNGVSSRKSDTSLTIANNNKK